FGGFAYVTDVSRIPQKSVERLRGLDFLVLDALRFNRHPTHFNLEQALEVVSRIKPKRTALTHLSHDFDHDEVNKTLPSGVELAYDGMKVTI
ncbi:MAG: MBL fold metallo-hydrolase, partial [bacterium]